MLIQGTATLSAATTATIPIGATLSGTSYQVSLSLSASTTSPPWVTAKTTSSFGVNFATAYTGSVDWIVDLGGGIAISGLPSGVIPTGPELFPAVQGSTTVSLTAAQLAAAALASTAGVAAGSTPSGSEKLPAIQGGSTVYLTSGQIAALVTLAGLGGTTLGAVEALNYTTLATVESTFTGDYIAALTQTVTDRAVLASGIRTPAEIAAVVTPVNYAWPELWVERYGADPTGAADSGVAFRSACMVAAQKGGGIIRAYGALYLFTTWDTTSFYASNNLALFLLPANTELAGAGQFGATKLRISQTARTGMYASGANRTHIIGMAANTGGQYVHDLEFDWDGIVQAAANDYCYHVRTCSGHCIVERCYSAQAPITNGVVDSSTDTANGNTPLGPTIVWNCWFQDSGPNMTGNSVNSDCSYIYLSAPGSYAEKNRLFNTDIAAHNCGGIEMHSAQYYAVQNYIKNCWPGMYIGVQDGVTISVGSRVERNYIGYCVGGISIVDQHEGLRIISNHFEANDDSAGAGFGHNFTDIFTPLDSGTGVNTAGIQTDLQIARNTFDETLYRQGTSRSSAGTMTADCVSINLSVLTGLSVDHNTFVSASPSSMQIVGSVTGAAQSCTIEENTFLDCMEKSVAGTAGYISLNISSLTGWASGPAAKDCFVRRNHLWRSGSYAISAATLGLANAGGTGPAATLTNVQFDGNDCDNVTASVSTYALTGQGQVALNGSDQDNFGLTANGQAIPTGFAVIGVNSGAAYTGLILQKGSQDGQTVTVINVNSNAQTMAASGTSNVANGTGCVIAANTSMRFVWNAGVSLWYANP
jgi:hypothetical protein